MALKKIPKEIKLEIVRAIVCGELLVNEAMSLYGIKYKKTIIRWVKALLDEVKENLKKENIPTKDKSVFFIDQECKNDQQDIVADGSSK